LLPSGIQSRIKEEYGFWKIQEMANLSRHASKRWQSENPPECPGLAAGHFDATKLLSYAVLLVPAANPDGGYRFLIFFARPGQSAFEVTLLDESDQNGASNYFIRGTLLSRFFDEPSRKKFQVNTPDGVLLVDSAESEYEVDVYFWTSAGYRHEPIDY
jgi:hypothetical protein